MRVITLKNNIVTSVKYVGEDYILQSSELVHDYANFNQLKLDDGTFIDVQVEPVVQPSIEEKILAENQYQTMLLELSTMGGI